MLRAIEFKDKRFMTKDDNNLFSPITENTIILCHNYKLMDSLAKEILNTVNGKAEYNDYDCDDEDVGQAKMWLSFGLQRVIDINGQRITLALEPAIIYKANDIKDIWFFSYQGTDEIETLSPYQEFIYPMAIFKGSQKVWEDGKDEVYKVICNGRYGTYDGKWVNLSEEHWDDRTHNCVSECNLPIKKKSQEDRVTLVDEVAEIGDEIHIWKDGELVFKGKYSKDNLYAKEEVIAVGYDEDTETNEVYNSFVLK